MDADTENAGAERRRHARFPFAARMRCTPVHAGKVLGAVDTHAENVSAGGVAVYSNQPWNPGETLVISFPLPLAADDAASPYVTLPKGKPWEVVIRSRVAWCAPAANAQYRVGLEFVRLDPHTHKPFLNFLDRYSQN